jgi:hypothetical protein
MLCNQAQDPTGISTWCYSYTRSSLLFLKRFKFREMYVISEVLLLCGYFGRFLFFLPNPLPYIRHGDGEVDIYSYLTNIRR